MALADIFSGQIDFDSDLQPGDRFEVLLEKSSREGQFAGYGPILAARFSADGREHQAFRWANPDSARAAYYDASGRSLKRFMLRSPLKFEPRITSGFSRRRLHPVFRTFRAHPGIDYGAPAGAPVVAVSSGTVVSAGWAGGGGKQVHLRHGDGYETFYLHLSAFGAGIRAGARVDQGQVIGRVGSTGTATGPHLDYPAQAQRPVRQSSGDPAIATARRSDSDRPAGVVFHHAGRQSAADGRYRPRRGARPRASNCRRGSVQIAAAAEERASPDRRVHTAAFQLLRSLRRSPKAAGASGGRHSSPRHPDC